jgi:hypothetical protein
MLLQTDLPNAHHPDSFNATKGAQFWENARHWRLTFQMYILPIGGPHSKAEVRLGLGQSSLVQSSCRAEVGCISDRWDKNFLSTSWKVHRSLKYKNIRLGLDLAYETKTGNPQVENYTDPGKRRLG